MTALNKQALRERYSEKPAPKCHICGSVMTIQRAGAGGVVYGCTGRIDKDGEGYKFAEGRDFADDHYARSRVTVADESDPDVLALLDENLQLQRDKDSLEAVAIALRDDMRDAREKLEAAEKRIAELERSETQLINERDDAESAMNDAYKAVMGQAPEWSNWFSFADAIDEIELACRLWRNQTEDVIQFRQRIAELEARTVTMPPKEHDKGTDSQIDINAGFANRMWQKCYDAIRAAGIGVKGD
ncbi:ead/Ea22-like family protein [Citrobacter portucalensis]|uniref:ead/Ea22-like family protein n=1 Tax=Citrobacter portucalensis TaxID=1639133 RepID=UPI0028892F8C|nr:ead/Ea22-like family protein [Citrobacter portucalensis]WNI85878.1 ead/Ea22-like family protein [Citrobacter portucalensis]